MCSQTLVRSELYPKKRVLFADKKAQIEPTFFFLVSMRVSPGALDHSTRWDSALSLNLPHTSNPLIKGSPIGLRPEVYLEHLGHSGKEFPYSDDRHV